MTIDELFNEIEDKVRDTFIVTLKYKYDFEENYTIENQILEYDALDDSYAWLNDWYEGQSDVEVLGYMPLGGVNTTKPLTCDDCISRQAVIDLVADYDLHMGQVVRGIHALPSVTLQPKIGRWVEEKINGWSRKVFCSECGGPPPFVHVSNGDVYTAGGYGVIHKTKFCPNCGAKMEEGKE